MTIVGKKCNICRKSLLLLKYSRMILFSLKILKGYQLIIKSPLFKMRSSKFMSVRAFSRSGLTEDGNETMQKTSQKCTLSTFTYLMYCFNFLYPVSRLQKTHKHTQKRTAGGAVSYRKQKCDSCHPVSTNSCPCLAHIVAGIFLCHGNVFADLRW